MAFDVALGVQAEIQRRSQEADRLRRARVERARYEAQLAQQRYMRVDPLCHLHRNVASDAAGPLN